MVSLSEKQKFVIENLKDQEKMCVEKYQRGEAAAKDPELKELFRSIGKEEQQHYNSLDQLLHGTVVKVNTVDKAGTDYKPEAAYVGNFSQSDKENDKFLCTDSITTEKYVSSAYNFELFQFADPDVRRLLNDIETEEQNLTILLIFLPVFLPDRCGLSCIPQGVPFRIETFLKSDPQIQARHF